MIEMGFEITIKSFDTNQILKIIIDTVLIEDILKHVKDLIGSNEILKIKKQIPIIDIDNVLVC
jgi:hypothetical protein